MSRGILMEDHQKFLNSHSILDVFYDILKTTRWNYFSMVFHENSFLIDSFHFVQKIEKIFYLSVSGSNALSMSTESGNKIGGGEKTVLVSIHDTESLLKLLDSRVGERFEDVSFLRHGGGFCWYCWFYL